MPVPKVSVLERVDCIFEKMCPKELEEEEQGARRRAFSPEPVVSWSRGLDWFVTN